MVAVSSAIHDNWNASVLKLGHALHNVQKGVGGGDPLPTKRDYLFLGIFADRAPTMVFMSLGSPVG
jgi:hypothetical protein